MSVRERETERERECDAANGGEERDPSVNNMVRKCLVFFLFLFLFLSPFLSEGLPEKEKKKKF